jgi:hypothetical protein
MLLPHPSIEKIEEAITALQASDESTLEIWSERNALTSFCAEVALLQFVITWARRKERQSIAHFPDLFGDSQDFERSLQKALGAPHVVSAWVLASKLSDARGRMLKRAEAKGYTSYLDAMDAYDFSSTHQSMENRVNLVCVQGGQREFIRPLYQEEKGTWVVKPEGEIRAMMQDILSRFVSSWTVKYLREVSEPLSHLTRELVENSDWWARMDQNGLLYSKGIRSIILRLIEVDDDNVIDFAGANHHLKSYLLHSLVNDEHSKVDAPSSRATQLRRLSFIELSVVDSGPGLARRWLASRPKDKKQISDLSEISREEEENALVECFRKWRTSSANSLRGIGLFSVARLLQRRNGFMRLRTGRFAFLFGTQSAISDIENRYKKESSGKQLEDYFKLNDGTHVFVDSGKIVFFLRPWSDDALEQVEGTSYSILLPV